MHDVVLYITIRFVCLFIYLYEYFVKALYFVCVCVWGALKFVFALYCWGYIYIERERVHAVVVAVVMLCVIFKI